MAERQFDNDFFENLEFAKRQNPDLKYKKRRHPHVWMPPL